jgi:acyl-CoA reductase-like NAD-dependent aldehyde dehydrogenase
VELPVEVVPGGAEVGQALVDAGPDMVLFTGAAANGPDVLRASAPHLIPVILELGGKDPMLVFEDADLERAANAAVYGAFAHAGQHCVSVKRLYVQEGVRPRLLDLLEEKTRDLAGKDEWGEVREGLVLEDAREQVRGALEDGARLLFPDDETRAATVPTLIADATHAMRIMREETFAPVLPVAGFGSEEEAAQLANDCPYGLNASVWSRDGERCERVVRRLETGNVFVNDVLTNIGNPHLPFGGAKRSGLWHYHGEQGLLQFCRPVAIMENRGHAEAELGWFPHDEAKAEVFDELIQLRYGDTGLIERAVRWLKLGRRLRRGEE